MLVPDKFLLFRQLCYAKLAHMFSRSSVREPLSAKRLLISFSFFIIIIIIIFFLNIFFVDIIFPTIANCATEHFIMRLHVEQKRKKNGCGREWYPQRKFSFNGFVIGRRRFNDIFWRNVCGFHTQWWLHLMMVSACSALSIVVGYLLQIQIFQCMQNNSSLDRANWVLQLTLNDADEAITARWSYVFKCCKMCTISLYLWITHYVILPILFCWYTSFYSYYWICNRCDNSRN